MKNFPFLIFIFFCSLIYSQNKNLSISAKFPNNWLDGNKRVMKDNLQNFDFSSKDLKNLNNEIDKSKYIKVFYKYNPDNHIGLIPTLKTYLLPNSTRNFLDFSNFQKNEIHKLKKKVLNFEYIIEPKKIILKNKVEALYSSVSYNLKLQDGGLGEIRTIFLSIPIGKEYFYMTMIDNEIENCSVLYQNIIDSLQIEKN